jgi:transposase, IS5 family
VHPKGKAGKQYEFGNKVSVAVSSCGGWFVGATSFTGNPYDGDTLVAQMKLLLARLGLALPWTLFVTRTLRGFVY